MSEENLHAPTQVDLPSSTNNETGNGGVVGGNLRIFRLHLLGRCIFCLRKTTNKNRDVLVALPRNAVELLEVVPTAEVTLSSLLPTFNGIWPYLQKISETSDGDKKQVLGLFGPPNQNESRKVDKSTAFNRLPTMCQYCVERLEAVDRLWRQLVAQMDGLGTTIKESKQGGRYWWRGEGFERNLINSTLEDAAIHDVLEFLKIESPFLELNNGSPSPSPTPPPEDEEDEAALSSVEAPNDQLEIPTVVCDDIIDSDIPVPVSTIVTKSEEPVVVDNPVPRRLSRQSSVDIPSMTCKPRALICRQSSDFYTSHEISFDQTEEGEQADDEYDTEYIRLEPEGLSSSDDDTTTDDESTSLSCDEDAKSVIAYQDLSESCRGIGLYRNLTGSFPDLAVVT